MNNQLLWFTTRGAGAVSLILFSLVIALGVMARSRFGNAWWPRFLTPAFHRNLTLIAVVFLTLHIVTAAVDPFTHLGIAAVFVPFGSYYRTLWLGLGTLAFELMIAVVVTSLLSPIFGTRLWKALHFLSYPLWIMAFAHGLGTGSDSAAAWMEAVTVVSLLIVGSAICCRILVPSANPLALERQRAAAGFRGTVS